MKDIPIKYCGYLRYSISSVSMYLDLAPSGRGFLFCRGLFIFIRYRFINHCKILRICLPLSLQCGSFFWALLIEILRLFLHWIFFSSKKYVHRRYLVLDSYVILRSFESGDQISIPFSLILSKAVNLFYVLSRECLFCCS